MWNFSDELSWRVAINNEEQRSEMTILKRILGSYDVKWVALTQNRVSSEASVLVVLTFQTALLDITIAYV
jgi:hypothetical protein